MIVTAQAGSPAGEQQIATHVSAVLARRAALANPPVYLTVSDAVARAIAGTFRSRTDHGQVLDRFHRTGFADADELIEAARFEQGYASPEGHAALYCLIGWARSRVASQVASHAMTDQSSCDVVGCEESPRGSYLAAGPARATEFVVCQAHFAKMQAGQRPRVVQAEQAASGLAARSSLLLD